MAPTRLVAGLAIIAIVLGVVFATREGCRDARPALDVLYRTLSEGRRFPELSRKLRQKEILFALSAPFLRRPKDNLSYVHYLKAQTEYARLQSIEAGEDWKKYYKERAAGYALIHRELGRAIDFDRSSRLDVQAAYMDWRMWTEQRSVAKTDEAMMRFKVMLLRYVERTGDAEILKQIADSLQGDGSVEDYIGSLYSGYVREKAGKEVKPREIFELLEGAWAEQNAPLVEALVEEFAASAFAKGTLRDSRAVTHLIDKLYTMRRDRIDEIRTTRPKDYAEIKNMNFALGAIVRACKIGIEKQDVLSDHLLFLMGLCLRQKGDLERAIQAFKKIVFSYPNSRYFGDAHFLVGKTLEVNKQVKLIPAHIKEVLARYPNHPLAENMEMDLGIIHRHLLGDEKHALEAFQAVLKYPGESVFKQVARQEIEEMRSPERHEAA